MHFWGGILDPKKLLQFLGYFTDFWRKKHQIIPKIRGRGLNPIWKKSENAYKSEGTGFPKCVLKHSGRSIYNNNDHICFLATVFQMYPQMACNFLELRHPPCPPSPINSSNTPSTLSSLFVSISPSNFLASHSIACFMSILFSNSSLAFSFAFLYSSLSSSASKPFLWFWFV